MTALDSATHPSSKPSRKQPKRSWTGLRTQKYLRTFLEWIVAIVLGLVVLFPILWLLKSSFQSPKDLFIKEPVFALSSFHLQNYLVVLKDRTILLALRNSLIIAGGSTLISTIAGIFSAYAFARLRFRGRNALFIGILLTQMLPGIVLVIPMFMIMRSLGLLSSYAGLLLAYVSFTLPYSIWLQRAYLANAPWELEDQARVDGCTRIGALVRVIVPTIAPGLVTAIIFAFINSWNEFLFALVLANPNTKTIPVRLSEYISQERIALELMFPASIIATIPSLILIAFFGRYIIRGLTAGALKG